MSLLVGTAVMCVTLAQTVDRFYAGMPDVLDPVLSKQQRVELLEYVKADMGDSIANRFGKQTHLEVLDTLNHRLVVRNTDVSTLEMKLLVQPGDTLIALIRTVCVPVCRSVMKVYDTRWNERADVYVPVPRSVEWLDEAKVRQAGLEVQNFRNMLTADFVTLAFDTTGQMLCARNHIMDYLEKAEREKLLPFLKDSCICREVKLPAVKP